MAPLRDLVHVRKAQVQVGIGRLRWSVTSFSKKAMQTVVRLDTGGGRRGTDDRLAVVGAMMMSLGAAAVAASSVSTAVCQSRADRAATPFLWSAFGSAAAVGRQRRRERQGQGRSSRRTDGQTGTGSSKRPRCDEESPKGYS